MARVRFFEPEMDRLLHSESGTTGRWLTKRGRLIMQLAKMQVGVKTGALRSSIHMRHFRDPRGQYLKIGSDLHYALMHHEGSRPHVIVPKTAKMLKFVSRGQVIVTHRVMHPGTKANKFLANPMKLVVRSTT